MRKQTSSLRKKHRHVKNNLLTDEFIYTGDHKGEMHIYLTQYDTDSYTHQAFSSPDKLPSLVQNGKKNWIHISGLSDTNAVALIGKSLGLYFTDIQDILTSQHIAKIETYEDKTFLIVNTFYYSEKKELQQEHICIILGKDYVFSFQESDLPLFENVEKAITQNTARVRNRPVDYLFCLLVNNVFSNYLDVIASLEDILEVMEDEIVTGNPRDDFGNRIQENRRDYLQLKKSMLPLKDDFNKLMHNENKLVRDEDTIYLSDLEDRMLFIIQSIEICRETLASLLDLYFSNNDLKMNEIMKRLTVVATIFIPLTFVVGVWGMNFKSMPELDWKYGYLMAWGLMVFIIIGVWWYIKKQHWY
ncbi:magnesium/cobalt transporter CorA [Coprobacter sp.]